MIIPDADRAHESTDESYAHFDEHQRQLIKSMVAVPLMQGDSDSGCEFVLTVDTDRKGYFGGEEMADAQIGTLQANLAHRILYEVDVKRLLGN